MGGNNIDADGIAVLMAALRGNTTLKTLELGYNPIEEKGAEELSAAIKYDLPVRTSVSGWRATAPCGDHGWVHRFVHLDFADDGQSCSRIGRQRLLLAHMMACHRAGGDPEVGLV